MSKLQRACLLIAVIGYLAEFWILRSVFLCFYFYFYAFYEGLRFNLGGSRAELYNVDYGLVSGDYYLFSMVDLPTRKSNFRRIKDDETLVWETTSVYASYMSPTVTWDETKLLYVTLNNASPAFVALNASDGSLINGIEFGGGTYLTNYIEAEVKVSSDSQTAYINLLLTSPSDTAAI